MKVRDEGALQVLSGLIAPVAIGNLAKPTRTQYLAISLQQLAKKSNT